jgi:hypothetical protein
LISCDPQSYQFHVAGAVDPEVYDEPDDDGSRPFELAAIILSDCTQANNITVRLLAWVYALDANPLVIRTPEQVAQHGSCTIDVALENIVAVNKILLGASVTPQATVTAKTVLLDIVSKDNSAMRLLNWCLTLHLSATDVTSFEDVGAIAGVGRAAASKDCREIDETYPEMCAKDREISRKHQLSNRTRNNLV